MNTQKLIETISKILNKKISANSNSKLTEIDNIDSLDFVKLIVGFKSYGKQLSISDIENLTIQEIINKMK